MSSNTVAMTILRQLGGAPRLSAMIGAKNFLMLDDGVSFQFPNRLRSKPNYCKVTLDPRDTYTVTLGRIKNGDLPKSQTFEGIYADTLVGLIERETGLYLSL